MEPEVKKPVVDDFRDVFERRSDMLSRMWKTIKKMKKILKREEWKGPVPRAKLIKKLGSAVCSYVIHVNSLAVYCLANNETAKCEMLLNEAKTLSNKYSKTKESTEMRLLTLNNLSCFLRNQGKDEQALAQLRYACKLGSSTILDSEHLPVTYLNLSALLCVMNRHEASFKEAQIAISLAKRTINVITKSDSIPLRKLSKAQRIKYRNVSIAYVIGQYNAAIECTYLGLDSQSLEYFKKAKGVMNRRLSWHLEYSMCLSKAERRPKGRKLKASTSMHQLNSSVAEMKSTTAWNLEEENNELFKAWEVTKSPRQKKDRSLSPSQLLVRTTRENKPLRRETYEVVKGEETRVFTPKTLIKKLKKKKKKVKKMDMPPNIDEDNLYLGNNEAVVHTNVVRQVKALKSRGRQKLKKTPRGRRRPRSASGSRLKTKTSKKRPKSASRVRPRTDNINSQMEIDQKLEDAIKHLILTQNGDAAVDKEPESDDSLEEDPFGGQNDEDSVYGDSAMPMPMDFCIVNKAELHVRSKSPPNNHHKHAKKYIPPNNEIHHNPDAPRIQLQAPGRKQVSKPVKPKVMPNVVNTDLVASQSPHESRLAKIRGFCEDEPVGIFESKFEEKQAHVESKSVDDDAHKQFRSSRVKRAGSKPKQKQPRKDIHNAKNVAQKYIPHAVLDRKLKATGYHESKHGEKLADPKESGLSNRSMHGVDRKHGAGVPKQVESPTVNIGVATVRTAIDESMQTVRPPITSTGTSTMHSVHESVQTPKSPTLSTGTSTVRVSHADGSAQTPKSPTLSIGTSTTRISHANGSAQTPKSPTANVGTGTLEIGVDEGVQTVRSPTAVKGTNTAGATSLGINTSCNCGQQDVKKAPSETKGTCTPKAEEVQRTSLGINTDPVKKSPTASKGTCTPNHENVEHASLGINTDPVKKSTTASKGTSTPKADVVKTGVSLGINTDPVEIDKKRAETVSKGTSTPTGMSMGSFKDDASSDTYTTPLRIDVPKPPTATKSTSTPTQADVVSHGTNTDPFPPVDVRSSTATKSTCTPKYEPPKSPSASKGTSTIANQVVEVRTQTSKSPTSDTGTSPIDFGDRHSESPTIVAPIPIIVPVPASGNGAVGNGAPGITAIDATAPKARTESSGEKRTVKTPRGSMEITPVVASKVNSTTPRGETTPRGSMEITPVVARKVKSTTPRTKPARVELPVVDTTTTQELHEDNSVYGSSTSSSLSSLSESSLSTFASPLPTPSPIPQHSGLGVWKEEDTVSLGRSTLYSSDEFSDGPVSEGHISCLSMSTLGSSDIFSSIQSCPGEIEGHDHDSDSMSSLSLSEGEEEEFGFNEHTKWSQDEASLNSGSITMSSLSMSSLSSINE